MKFDTRAVHAGLAIDPSTGAVRSPIHLSTTFERGADGGYPHGYIYARKDNPNRAALEVALAKLEGGAAAMAFSSGQAAIACLLGTLTPGDHVLAPRDIYYEARLLIADYFGGWGLTNDFVDMTDLDAVRAAVRPETALVWAETPSNPTLSICDIAALAAIAGNAGALLGVDNTWASPTLQTPLALGADVVMHSTTKSIAGHSDVTGGALVFAREDETLERARTIRNLTGATPSPIDCWLTGRGLETLPVRMERACACAGAVARFLAEHGGVETVNYPGLAGHPGHAIAARQMRAFGSMLSFTVHGGATEALAVAARTQLFIRATSLGGTHSLIEHRASIEGPLSTTPANLLRVSVGLEHPDDLIADLAQALE